MRTFAPLLVAALACALAPPGAQGRPAQAPASAPAAASTPASSPRPMEARRYRNVDGVAVHVPAHTDTGAAPAGASAQCRDGSWSFSLHHRGKCSHHGGVVRWM